jgi:tripartite-type tricarboxylate transporter receptor subunit TctC
VIASLQNSVAAAIRHPAVNKKLTDFGVEPVGSSSAEFAALIASESTRWQKLIRELKIFLD